MDDTRSLTLADLTDYLAGEGSPAERAIIAQQIADGHVPTEMVGYLQAARRELHAPPIGEEARDLAKRLEVVSRRLADEVNSRYAPDHVQSAVAQSTLLQNALLQNGPLQNAPLQNAPSQTTVTQLARAGAGTAPTTAPRRTGSMFSRPMVGLSLGVSILAAALLVFFSPFTDHGPQREHITGKGARATIRLIDGTTVTLGASSKLRYQSLTNGDVRAVYLEGEAYFDVAADPDAPFIVYTAHAATQVLGTEFSIRQYPGDSIAQIVVAEGKVAFRPLTGASGTGTTLVRGDLGRMTNAGLATVVRNVSIDSYTSWTHGVLTFPNTTLGDAIQDVERWYDLKITLSDSTLASAALVGTLSARSGSEAVQRIADALNLRVSQQGQSITLSPAGSR